MSSSSLVFYDNLHVPWTTLIKNGILQQDDSDLFKSALEKGVCQSIWFLNFHKLSFRDPNILVS